MDYITSTTVVDGQFVGYISHRNATLFEWNVYNEEGDVVVLAHGIEMSLDDAKAVVEKKINELNASQ